MSPLPAMPCHKLASGRAFAQACAPCWAWNSSRPTARRSNAPSATRASSSTSTRCWRSRERCAASRPRSRVCARHATRSAPGSRARRPEEKADLGAKAKKAGADAGELETQLDERETALKALMLQLPGIPWDGAPVGPDEVANTVVRTEGTPPKFAFEPLDHVALDREERLGRPVADHAGVGLADLLPQGAAGAARSEADGLGAGDYRRGRLHADHRAGAGTRAGVPQPGPVPGPQGRNLRACATTICGWPGPRRSR